MPKPITTKPNPKSAWTKALHSGEEGSVWRISGEIIDREMKSARKLLDDAALPFTARDLVRLTEALYKARSLPGGIVGLAKARLDREAIPYTAADVVEMVALLIECMDVTAEIMAEDEAEHMANCPDCAGQARH